MSFPVAAEHELYLDVGVNTYLSGDVKQFTSQGEAIEWNNPIGMVEVGYTYNRFTVYLSHHSSMQAEDQGINLFGLKMRVLNWK